MANWEDIDLFLRGVDDWNRGHEESEARKGTQRELAIHRGP